MQGSTVVQWFMNFPQPQPFMSYRQVLWLPLQACLQRQDCQVNYNDSKQSVGVRVSFKSCLSLLQESDRLVTYPGCTSPTVRCQLGQATNAPPPHHHLKITLGMFGVFSGRFCENNFYIAIKMNEVQAKHGFSMVCALTSCYD